MAYYLFTETEAAFLEEESENKLVEIETRNKSIGYIQEKKEILRSYRVALFSSGITLGIMAFLQRQKRVMVKRLKAEKEKEVRKNLRRNN